MNGFCRKKEESDSQDGRDEMGERKVGSRQVRNCSKLLSRDDGKEQLRSAE